MDFQTGFPLIYPSLEGPGCAKAFKDLEKLRCFERSKMLCIFAFFMDLYLSVFDSVFDRV